MIIIRRSRRMGGSGDPAETNVIAEYLNAPMNCNTIDLSKTTYCHILFGEGRGLRGGAAGWVGPTWGRWGGVAPAPPPNKNVTHVRKYIFKSIML